MQFENLKEFLEERVDFYNTPAFIETDPIQVPHLFSKPQDIEIAGFFAATFAWGQRKTIINKSLHLMKLMDNSPFEFISSASVNDFKRFEKFCHRTFNDTDTLYFLSSLKNIYDNHGGLSTVFQKGFANNHNANSAIMYFRSCFLEMEYPPRTTRHIPDISKGSAAKRINMFLRWMVRNDKKGVDFGLWNGIDPAWLSIPLDLHAGRTARQLGLLNRKYDDWQAVDELTGRLRELDPRDPVKYDFALFGLSISGNL